ncbi:GFA family protein [Lysobacter sp. GCM10012299]|uniref:GFA family protein n=1 Tax=Lysobacter sp. GCM10012299 TaxID=3317333 RepID=UPI0036205C84
MFSTVCHCRDCQRASGSGGVPVLGVARSSFVSRGPIKQVRTKGGSGHAAVRNFCMECGSLLYGTPESAPELVTIYAGTLDDPADFHPHDAIFVAHRPAWAKLAMELVEHSEFPGT